MAHGLKDGLRLAGDPKLSAAIVDLKLSDGDGTALCERLTERGIPFVVYSGYAAHKGSCSGGTFVAKPATTHKIVSTIAGLLR